MKFTPQRPLAVLCVIFTLITLFSCSKDSDLMADYVALDPDIGTIAKFVANDSYLISISDNPEDDTFDITVNSGSGGTNNGENGGAVNDSYEISTSLSIVLDVLANDTFDNPENVSIVDTSQPNNGNVVINSDNTLTYTPSTIEASENTFTYTAEFVKEDGTVDKETGTVRINIIPSTLREGQVNFSVYGAVGDGVTDDTAALQAAFDAETDLFSDAGKTYLVSGPLFLNQNKTHSIDFNGSTITSNINVGYMINIDKRNYVNTLTTIQNLKLDGNNVGSQGIDIKSRVNFQNIEIYDVQIDCANGIRILVYNSPGMYGQSVFDNVDIHDIVSVNNDASIGNCAGMVHAFLVSNSQMVTQDVQIVYKNSDIYNTWGEDAGGITINSPGLDTSNSPLSFWFENVHVSDAQRRTVKNFIGNTTWVNCTFTSAAYDNPNLAKPPNGLPPAGLFSVGTDSGALGSTNNLICGCTFEGNPSDPMNSWYTELILIGSSGPASVEIRNSTFTGGMTGRWVYNGITAYGAGIQDITIQNSTFAATSAPAVDKTIKVTSLNGTFLLDSNNSYAAGKATTLAPTTKPYTELNMPFEACPSIDD